MNSYAVSDEKMVEATKLMIDFVSPTELKKSLIDVFLPYMVQNHELLPQNIGQMVEDFYFLFKFLDSIEKPSDA